MFHCMLTPPDGPWTNKRFIPSFTEDSPLCQSISRSPAPIVFPHMGLVADFEAGEEIDIGDWIGITQGKAVRLIPMNQPIGVAIESSEGNVVRVRLFDGWNPEISDR